MAFRRSSVRFRLAPPSNPRKILIRRRFLDLGRGRPVLEPILKRELVRAALGRPEPPSAIREARAECAGVGVSPSLPTAERVFALLRPFPWNFRDTLSSVKGIVSGIGP
jgi:hypothetical protein